MLTKDNLLKVFGVIYLIVIHLLAALGAIATSVYLMMWIAWGRG